MRSQLCCNASMKKDKTSLHLRTSEDVINRLQWLASHYGYIGERGNLVGKPSITKLLEAIADGSVRLVKNFPTQTENIQ